MKSVWLGAISGVAMLVWLIKFLCFAPDGTSFIESINPVVAIEGLAFAFGFGLGVPTPFAVIAAVGLFILIPYATFLLIRRLTRRFDKS
jgi:hypothetical protein